MSKKVNAAEMPLVAHLIELRDRLLRALLGILLIFLALVSFANDLYRWLAEPLMAHLPENATMIATEVASPFFTPFKLTIFVSMFVAMPFILYQAWGFIAPGLYKHERRLVVPLLASSSILFYLGALFAYYVVFPIVFGFFTSVAPEGVSVMTDIAKYLDFVLKMFFAFGFAFEVPIVTFVLCWIGVTTPEDLGKKRPYIIVAAFVIGMLLTPPDAISQTLLAVPMILLFEAGLLAAKLFAKNRKKFEAEEEAEPYDDGGEPDRWHDDEDREFDIDKEFEKAMQEEDRLHKSVDDKKPD